MARKENIPVSCSEVELLKMDTSMENDHDLLGEGSKPEVYIDNMKSYWAPLRGVELFSLMALDTTRREFMIQSRENFTIDTCISLFFIEIHKMSLRKSKLYLA